MRKQVVHATNICGIEDLMKNNTNDYLCCSSVTCLDFFHREVLFLIDGNVAREYYGDIGAIGMGPKKTDYDELHVEGYEVVGLYIPNNMKFFDLYDYAKAKSYINCVLELPIDVLNASAEQLEIISKFEEEIEDLDESDYNELMGIE